MSWQTCGAGFVPHPQLPCNLALDNLPPLSSTFIARNLLLSRFLCYLARSAVRLIMHTSLGILDSDLVDPFGS
jgi:hypothetical protein